MDDSVFFVEPTVNLVGMNRYPSEKGIGPEELSVYGAMGCFKEESSYKLLKEDFAKKNDAELEKKKIVVLKNSAGLGHGSVLDQTYFTFSIENLTRGDTLFLCSPNYLAHLQQSLRRAKADKAFHIPKSLRESKSLQDIKDTLMEAVQLYERMGADGIPNEDARYALPLFTKNNIQTSGDARELIHLVTMLKQGEVPSTSVKVVEKMVAAASEHAPNLFTKWGHNYETLAFYPAPIFYSSGNKVVNKMIELKKEGLYVETELEEEVIDAAVRGRDETALSVLKHIHNGGKVGGFLVPMSLACYHQAVRQRTWDQSIESIFDAAERAEHVVPPTIEHSKYADTFKKFVDEMMGIYRQLLKEGVERREAIGVVPHSLEIFDLIHVNGWNALHSMGKRMCTEAQWEIRIIANQIGAELRKRSPIAGKYTYPQGVIYGKCPERVSCGLCDKILERMEKEKK